jgi:cell wall assembly regulator SMI1
MHSGSGNHYCADLDPAPGGHVGQIIWFQHTDGPIRVVASGFADWLRQYAADLEGGRYRLQPPFDVVDAGEPD